MLARGIRWHLDADIVVVGSGSAGAVAAITAHDAGAKVIILEKQDEKTQVTNSSMAGGGTICPNSVAGAMSYQEALNKVGDFYWTSPDIVEVWARYAVENKKWYESMGGAMELSRHGGAYKVPGYESIDAYSIRGFGLGLMRVLSSQVSARGIPVIYDTPATGLLENTRGEVIGVRARRNADEGKVVNVQARRAVILACGGYEFNEQMKLQYLKVYPVYFDSALALNGDGITMAMEIGADLWHMNCWAAGLRMKFPELPFALNTNFGGKNWRNPGWCVLPDFGGAGRQVDIGPKGGFIIVDRYGKRFMDENSTAAGGHELTVFDSKKNFYPRIPSYWIFDQKRMDDDCLCGRSFGPAGPAGLYQWSPDNSVELEKGWIKSGHTIAELAAKLGMGDPQTLVKTINNYNRRCEHGHDTEYGRLSTSLIPLNNPPYYAVELWPGGPNTFGGPRRNAKSQVMRVDGSPIPRLYGAGELGSVFSMLYTHGGNLSECIAFGRVAGENASECSPL